MPDNNLNDQLRQKAHANEIKDKRMEERLRRKVGDITGLTDSQLRRAHLTKALREFGQKFVRPEAVERRGVPPPAPKIETEQFAFEKKTINSGDTGSAPAAPAAGDGGGGLIVGLFNIQGELREVVFSGQVTSTTFPE